MIQSYDNFFLPTGSLEESRKFYTALLGLNIKFDFSDRGLLAFKVGEEEPAIILKDQSMFPDAKPSIVFTVENVEETARDLEGKGVKFTKKPYKIITGWAAEFTDPSGNLLGITDYRK
jgi:predicted enzyme related to lactoylglutathione lyase